MQRQLENTEHLACIFSLGNCRGTLNHNTINNLIICKFSAIWPVVFYNANLNSVLRYNVFVNINSLFLVSTAVVSRFIKSQSWLKFYLSVFPKRLFDYHSYFMPIYCHLILLLVLVILIVMSTVHLVANLCCRTGCCQCRLKLSSKLA